MTIDSEGNIYLSNHGVTIFDKTGRQIQHIDIKENWTGNVCFGGADRQTLFITASKGLYAIRMRVHGVGSQMRIFRRAGATAGRSPAAH